MKRVAISIPVHECALCIENQILNIRKFVPNSFVVIHVSGDSPQLWDEIMRFQPKYNGFLHLNPTRFRTFKHDEAAQVYGLSTVHASNIKFANSIGPFDVMAFETSNDMFVRKGIENDFNQYLCGCSSSQRIPPDIFPYKELLSDLRRVITVKFCEKAPQEGFWCPRDAALFFADKIFELMSLLNRATIPAEEGFLPNLILNQFPELYNSMIPQFVYHDPNEGASVKMEMIYKVRNGELPYIYAVKRIPRRIDDATRIFVNELTKND